MDQIKDHPVYICNQIAMRFGAVAAALAAVAVLFYSSPMRFPLAASVAALVPVYYFSEKYLLPRVRTFKQLDRIVLAYNIPVLLSQWIAVWCFPEVEVSTGTAGIIVITGLLFYSTAWFAVFAFVMGASWIAIKSYFGATPTANEQVQLLLIVPLMATVARLAMASAVNSLQSARKREQDTIRELRGTLEKLREATNMRQNAEAQLLRSQKYESLGLMAAGVAHDFNNMLSAISAYTEVIGLITAEQAVKSHATEIAKAVQQAAAICRQMLVYAGKSTGQMTSVDLVNLVEDLKPLMQATFAGRVVIGVDVDVENALVIGNAVQLQQVLMNLITNGAEAIEGNGTLHIRIYRQSIEEGAGDEGQETRSKESEVRVGNDLDVGDYNAIAVTDSGSGMSLETVRQMFDPYFTTKGSGHGFGLSMVLGIAKSHNATVDVWSKAGVGTRVTLLFPVATDSGEQHSAKLEKAISEGLSTLVPRVLLVDDDPQVRNSAEHFLSSQGWDVVKAESGEVAVDFVSASPNFAAILLDYNLPKINGSETLKRIRQLGCSAPAILCSGTQPPSSCIDTLFSAFLLKPFQHKELQALLQSLTSRKRDGV